jgi:hypothetical protein
MTLPLTANELYRYGKWLGKGVYYIQHGELLAPDQPIWVDLVGQEEVNFIKRQYWNRHGSDAFEDLSKNVKIPNLNKETFLIFNDESREIYVCFNRVLMFHIRILDKTFINQKKCAKALRTLKKGWEIVLMHAFDVHFFACVFLFVFCWAAPVLPRAAHLMHLHE